MYPNTFMLPLLIIARSVLRLVSSERASEADLSRSSLDFLARLRSPNRSFKESLEHTATPILMLIMLATTFFACPKATNFSTLAVDTSLIAAETLSKKDCCKGCRFASSAFSHEFATVAQLLPR